MSVNSKVGLSPGGAHWDNVPWDNSLGCISSCRLLCRNLLGNCPNSEQLGSLDFSALIGRSNGYHSCEKSFLPLKPRIPENCKVNCYSYDEGTSCLQSDQVQYDWYCTACQSLFAMSRLHRDGYRKTISMKNVPRYS